MHKAGPCLRLPPKQEVGVRETGGREASPEHALSTPAAIGERMEERHGVLRGEAPPWDGGRGSSKRSPLGSDAPSPVLALHSCRGRPWIADAYPCHRREPPADSPQAQAHGQGYQEGGRGQRNRPRHWSGSCPLLDRGRVVASLDLSHFGVAAAAGVCDGPDGRMGTVGGAASGHQAAGQPPPRWCPLLANGRFSSAAPRSVPPCRLSSAGLFCRLHCIGAAHVQLYSIHRVTANLDPRRSTCSSIRPDPGRLPSTTLALDPPLPAACL